MKALKLLYYHPSWRSPVSLTIEKLKSISVSLVPYDEQRIYARLEHSLSELVAKREGLKREENLQYREGYRRKKKSGISFGIIWQIDLKALKVI